MTNPKALWVKQLYFIAVAACLLAAARGLPQDTNYPPSYGMIPGPAAPKDAAAWRADLEQWREQRLILIGYNGSQYKRPELEWTQRSFIQPQMMAQDRYFYNPETGRYTVGRYLDDLEKRFGGIDSVLIWPTYPNLGIDNRNQFDLIRDMPGGIEGLRATIADFHRHGVRVLFPYNPWDRGTRPEGATDWDAVARLMAAIGADGINGDTMPAVPFAFRAASDRTGHPIAFEPQIPFNGPDEALAWNNLSWFELIIPTEFGHWRFPFVPEVYDVRWLEPRHMVNVCDRWARDKTNDLQFAFFNGTGYESWENIWGIWNQIDDRDAQALRRIAKIERAFWQDLGSPAWEPFFPMLRYGAFASKWPGRTETLWTIVNRNEFNLEGVEMRVSYKPGLHYYDLWHGVELKPAVHGSVAELSFRIAANGYATILATQQLTAEEASLLNQLHDLAQRPLSSYSSAWHFLPQHIVPIPATKPAASAPPGMVYVPGGKFFFHVSGVEIEGENMIGLDVQYPWEDTPRRHHAYWIVMKPFYIDKFPVTNAEFKKFLDATHYHPRDDHNFLRDWNDGAYLKGWVNKPVTWVSLDDARAYATWAGKRLPHEWEWQYAAQGNNDRLYPWGNQWNNAAVPLPDKGRTLRGPDDVNAHPQGASPFGVMDMVGNVWQWTDEFVDEHTRAAILQGGSYFQPQGSMWYFPQTYRLDEHGKYLLMSPGIDRSGTVGFRCVKDAE
jgi:gamma-glutamyl hercynylcysteine S-oxide synthase